MATVYPVSTYSLATIAVTVASASGTPTYIWSAPVPAGAKGKAGVLQLFFNLYVATNFFAGQNFNYGIYVDGVSLAIGDTTTVQYTHTAATPYAINSGGVVRGTNGFTGFSPLLIPVSFSSGASVIQIGITNSSLSMSSVTSASPFVTSNIFTATGTVGSNNYYPATVFTTTGSGLNYTVPTTVYSVGGTSNNVVGVFIYCWGSAGTPANNYACGTGGFASGYYPCSGGTNLSYIVGSNDGFNNPNTGGSWSSYAPGGFSGVLLSNAGGVAQSNVLVIAGGGGSCLAITVAGGNGGGGAASSNASGIGYNGGTPYIFGTGYSTVITGGTLSAGGIGTTGNGIEFVGRGTMGGGGGYYGGGGGTNTNTQPTDAGGGGSSFAANAVIGASFASGVPITSRAIGTVPVAPGGTTSPYYVQNSNNYGYGGLPSNAGGVQYSHQGLVVIVPAIGASANQIGVQANIFVV
jgi:hypothetical protein